jgi:hypothetical protein
MSQYGRAAQGMEKRSPTGFQFLYKSQRMIFLSQDQGNGHNLLIDQLRIICISVQIDAQALCPLFEGFFTTF